MAAALKPAQFKNFCRFGNASNSDIALESGHSSVVVPVRSAPKANAAQLAIVASINHTTGYNNGDLMLAMISQHWSDIANCKTTTAGLLINGSYGGASVSPSLIVTMNADSRCGAGR
jgi:hypothetical protein